MTNEIRFRAILDDKVSAGLRKINNEFDRLGGKGSSASLFGNVGADAVAKGFSLIEGAAARATDFIFDSIQAASDMNETFSKSKVIFQTSANEVEEWGSTAARTMGITEQSALEAAASFGKLFHDMGQTDEVSAQMSETLVKLASDLASFDNIPVDEALQKLQSGLAGEAKPLRALGVFLNDTTVKTKALQLGLAKQGDTLTDSQKILARYALILEQTTDAQGDFARTADQMANQQRILSAQLEDNSVKLGQRFIPAVVGGQRVVIALFDSLDALDGKAKESSQIYVEDADALLQWTRSAEGIFPPLKVINDLLADQNKKNAEAAKDWDTHSESLGAYHAAAEAAASAAGDLSDGIHESAHQAASLKKELDGAGQAARDNLDDILTAVYGPAELKGQESTLRHEIGQTKKDIAEAKRTGKGDIKEMQGHLAELRSDLVKTWEKEQALGVKPEGEGFNKWLHARTAYINGVYSLALAHALYLERQLTGAYGNPGSHNYDRGRAGGGPVVPGNVYDIGEMGPERLVMTGSGGYVIPGAGQRRVPAGGGTTLVYSPQFSTASAAEAQMFSRMVVPELVREMRRQGVA